MIGSECSEFLAATSSKKLIQLHCDLIPKQVGYFYSDALSESLIKSTFFSSNFFVKSRCLLLVV